MLFSNYYLGDGSSGTTTSSGLSISDFKVVDDLYTYKGKVVLATANNSLGKLKQGYIAHELYDELTIKLNGNEYPGIVLDKCGTCTWGNDYESLQRIDIFTTGDVIGLKQGYVSDE